MTRQEIIARIRHLHKLMKRTDRPTVVELGWLHSLELKSLLDKAEIEWAAEQSQRQADKCKSDGEPVPHPIAEVPQKRQSGGRRVIKKPGGLT